MTQRLLYILLSSLSLLLGTADALAWGESTSYIITDRTGDENKYNINGSSLTYDLNYIGERLTFDLEYSKIGWVYVSGTIKVSAYKEDGSEVSLGSFKRGDSPSVSLGTEYKSVKIYHNDGLTGAKYVKNVKITRATTLSASLTTINLGEVQKGETKTASFTVAYNNNTYNQQLTAASSNNAVVTLDKTSATLGETGSVTITASFCSNTLGAHSSNITLTTTNGGSITIPVTATVVGKVTPEFNMSLTSTYVGHVHYLSDIFSSSNTDITSTITSSDPSKGLILQGRLFILSGAGGSFTLTASQEGNTDYWEPRSETYTINIAEGNSETYKIGQSDFEIGSIGNKVLTVPAPSSSISYYTTQTWSAISYNNNTVQQSKDHGTSWETIKTFNPSTDGQDYEDAISPSATHIKFDRPTGNTMTLYVSKIYFHLAAYMTPSTSSVNFGEVMQGETSSAQTITVDWSDVQHYASTLPAVSDHETISVAPPQNNACTPANQTWGTTYDRWGQSTLSVQFSPETVGEHSGYIYFHDNKRFVRIPVSGTAYSNHLQLQPTVDLNTQRPDQEFNDVTLNRTLPAGFSTLTLPFDTNVSELTGAADGDYVAQLALVTYNDEDEYTLYFQKVADGTITANEPYVVYCTTKVTNPHWEKRHIYAPSAGTIEDATTLKGWTMTGNYTPGFSMFGKYGIVSKKDGTVGGELRKGLANSWLNAYTAYFTPPSDAANARTRVAILDEWGDVTYIGELKDDAIQPERIYTPNGVQHSTLQRGINIVRTADGSVYKVIK